MNLAARTRRSFTLVELLIVIVIIGILAAVAIPQFGDTSTDAKIAALDQNLACMRTAVELYHHQHNSTYPGAVGTSKIGELGSLIAHSSAVDALTKQLTSYSDASGNTTDTKNSSYPYGPYVRRGIPDNPLPAATAAASPAAVNVTADTGPLSADVKPTTGWKYSAQTGQFIANNSAYSSR